MIDQQKYINTYIDKAMGLLHEYIAQTLQYKTQLDLANSIIIEKDKLIEELTSNKSHYERQMEDSNNAMKVKLSHMDTLTSQLNDARRIIVEKTEEVDRLINENKELKKTIKVVPSKPINTKKQKIIPETESVDDF
jgi:hypothetical protein